MKIIEKTNEKVVFAEEMNESLANAIRRSALEIPVLAIDEVEFFKNDSVLYDEVLALRLGLVPLETPKDMILMEKCSCKGKGCSKCSAQLKITAKGPVTVYAKDLKGKADVIYPDMPLTVLAKDQELELVAYAKLGKGIEHTKFSPGLVYYSFMPEVSKASKEEIEGKKAIEVDEERFKEIKEGKGMIAYDLMNEIVHCNGDYISVKPGKEIAFFIESWGQISAKDILEGAVKALKENLKEVM